MQYPPEPLGSTLHINVPTPERTSDGEKWQEAATDDVPVLPTNKDRSMDMTGWISGQVFFQTVDQTEVEQINAFLGARGIASQILTQSEHMMLDPADPSVGVTSERFSIAVQLAGFPQVIGPVLNELVQRAHGGGWALEEPDNPPTAI